MATSPERCELEGALADAIFGNADSSSAGRVARRQASGTTFDADVRNDHCMSAVHAIFRGFSLSIKCYHKLSIVLKSLDKLFLTTQ